MERKSKSEIKKMIAELHGKQNEGAKEKGHNAEQAVGGKNSKSAAVNKTYRPKI